MLLFRSRRDTPAQRKVLLSDPASILALLVFSFPSPHRPLFAARLSTEQERDRDAAGAVDKRTAGLSCNTLCVHLFVRST